MRAVPAVDPARATAAGAVAAGAVAAGVLCGPLRTSVDGATGLQTALPLVRRLRRR